MQVFIGFIKIFLLIILLSGCATIKAQNNAYSTKKTTSTKALGLYKKGELAARKNDYKKANGFFHKAIKKDPQFVDAFIQLGGIAYEQKEFAKAKQHFAKATQMAPDYKPRLYYTLGVIAFKEKNYPLAIKQIEHFLSFEKINKRRRKSATKKLANIKFIAQAIQNPLPFKPQNLGEAINSTNPEYLPSFTADEQFMIFTRRVNNQEDFFLSQKVAGVFQPASPIEEINTDKNEGAQCISADGRFMAMTLCGRERTAFGSCDIFASVKRKGKWLAMRNIGKEINSKYWDAQPSLTANGDALYFASDRPGGKGGRDLWVSYRTGNKWGTPVNLASINTDGDDQAPFIHSDGKTLYFMSDGHPGMGEADLFMSRKQADGSWTKAVNLGYPINDEGQQGALVVSLDGRKGYFAGPKESAGEGPFFGAIDIFEFELPLSLRPDPVTYVKAFVHDQANQPLEAQIQVVDLANNKIYFTTLTDELGLFLSVLPSGKNYALHVTKPGYFFHSENFQLTDINDIHQPYELKIQLNKIQKSTADVPQKASPIILQNVFFDSGKSTLQPYSYYELDQLAKLLIDQSAIKIQINGHTDNVGRPADNMTLSQKRAEAVYDYLIGKGISASRLSYKGFGETQPIDSNETAEGRRNNRRTEFERL